MIASSALSCSGGLGEADKIDLSSTPLQKVYNMFAVQTETGVVQMRMEASVMEHYESDTSTYDLFPEGISVFAYTPEGLLESVIVADNARHQVPKRNAVSKSETWEAFGNVILHNILKQETMETDTIYWDQSNKEVYTHCYVKLYSPDGFTQGYGMRSDDRMRNSILYRPFNSYALTVQDSTAVVIDSVNFIGPFPKKITKFAAL